MDRDEGRGGERVFWIDGAYPGRLAIMARPRSGDWLEDAIDDWRSAGVDCVVSLLEPAEATELGLGSESDLCRASGMSFRTFPMADRGLPDSPMRTGEFVGSLVEELLDGKNVAIHCRMGIGRSALLAACALVVLGRTPDAAFSAISAARGLETPDTADQKDFVRRFHEMFLA